MPVTRCRVARLAHQLQRLQLQLLLWTQIGGDAFELATLAVMLQPRVALLLVVPLPLSMQLALASMLQAQCRALRQRPPATALRAQGDSSLSTAAKLQLQFGTQIAIATD